MDQTQAALAAMLLAGSYLLHGAPEWMDGGAHFPEAGDFIELRWAPDFADPGENPALGIWQVTSVPMDASFGFFAWRVNDPPQQRSWFRGERIEWRPLEASNGAAES